MTRGVIVCELLEDVTAERASAKHSEDLEGDDGRVRHAPSEVCCGIFTPYKQKSVNDTSKYVGVWAHSHNAANIPVDVLTCRPNTDNHRKDPSKVK